MIRKGLYIIASLTVLLLSQIVMGQSNINSTVEVKREFEGKLSNVHKSALSTRYSDTLMKLDLNFDYTIFDRPYKNLYEFSPMNSIKISREAKVDYPRLYAKVGIAYPWLPEADIYFQPKTKENLSFMAYINHDSFWGAKKEIIESPVNRMKTVGGLNGAYKWRSGELTLHASYLYHNHNFLYHSTMNPNDSLNSRYNSANAGFRVRSINSKFLYDFKFDYLNNRYNLSSEKLRENELKGRASVGAVLFQKSTLLVDFQLNSVFHRDMIFDSMYGTLIVTPQYRYESGRVKSMLGISFARVIGDIFKEDMSLAAIYPNVSVQWELFKNSLWLHAKIDGENRLVSSYSVYMMNPWSDYEALGNYATPIRGEVGMKGVIKDRFSYSLKGGYAYHEKYLNFSNNILYQSMTPLKKVKNLYLDAQMLYKSNQLSLFGSVRYDNFFNQKPNMTPNLTVSADAEYNYLERIFVNLGVKYIGRMTTTRDLVYSEFGSIELPAVVDLGLSVSYAVNRNLSAFIIGGNLLNQRIQYVYRYYEPGINFGVGVSYKL